MNYLGHALVAGRAPSSGPLTVLGAVLPDLAGMARLRYERGRLPGEVAAGVRTHHATDRAFHRDRAFVTGSGALRQAALAAGLPLGASRAIGHVGWELLLDGVLAESSEAVQCLEEALVRAPAVVPAFPAVDAARFLDLASDLRQQRWWRGYRDPSLVARRLHHVLATRRRLAFPAAALDEVARVLRATRPTVSAAAAALLPRVMAEMEGDGVADRPGSSPMGDDRRRATGERPANGQ